MPVHTPRDLEASALERLIWCHRPNRGTYLSRFWTVPAHRAPLSRRMLAVSRKAAA